MTKKEILRDLADMNVDMGRNPVNTFYFYQVKRVLPLALNTMKRGREVVFPAWVVPYLIRVRKLIKKRTYTLKRIRAERAVLQQKAEKVIKRKTVRKIKPDADWIDYQEHSISGQGHMIRVKYPDRIAILKTSSPIYDDQFQVLDKRVFSYSQFSELMMDVTDTKKDIPENQDIYIQLFSGRGR